MYMFCLNLFKNQRSWFKKFREYLLGVHIVFYHHYFFGYFEISNECLETHQIVKNAFDFIGIFRILYEYRKTPYLVPGIIHS